MDTFLLLNKNIYQSLESFIDLYLFAGDLSFVSIITHEEIGSHEPLLVTVLLGGAEL